MMTTPKLMMALLSLALAGCGDGAIDGYGDSVFGTGGVETWGDTSDGSCEMDSVATQCGDDGRCWVTRPEWSAWASYMDPAGLASAVDAGVITASGDGCYAVSNTDSHLCLVTIDCVTVLARPSGEVAGVPSTCAPLGPWSSVIEDAAGECWGAIDDSVVAVSVLP